jgi:Flp pilus assembly protein TadB
MQHLRRNCCRHQQHSRTQIAKSWKAGYHVARTIIVVVVVVVVVRPSCVVVVIVVVVVRPSCVVVVIVVVVVVRPSCRRETTPSQSLNKPRI